MMFGDPSFLKFNECHNQLDILQGKQSLFPRESSELWGTAGELINNHKLRPQI